LTPVRRGDSLGTVLVPGSDPPFVGMSFPDAESEIRLRAREGRELLRRLEAREGNAELVGRIVAARRTAFPQRFVVRPDDEPALLAALEDPPALQHNRLVALHESLRARRP
jgi:hypothetical protein